jgi:hypothetical protein
VSTSIANPYDFRAPIRSRQLLAGRSETLKQIDDFLRQAAAGRPVHFSLFGAPGVGKSSLLNAATEIADKRRLLPVKLALREATVESELAFYGALFEAGLEALIQRGVLQADGKIMESWLRCTRTGDLTVDAAQKPLEIALALAAELNGKMVRHIQVPSLMRDISRLLALSTGLKGLCLCIDSAEHLDDNRDVADSLLELANADCRVVVVTAAPHAGRLQARASRTWAQIEVGPFLRSQEVFEAMTRPLESGDRSPFALDPAAAEDIYKLTRGHPYEVKLVCHFIWEAVHRQRQADFQLSDAVIERVLAEFIERGRHESSADIALVAALTARDYEILSKLAPYEELTIREMAMTRLMPEEFDDATISQLEGSIRADLEALARRQIVRVQDDRFYFTVSDDARLYMRYAAERHTGERLDYGQTYTQQVTRICRADFGKALAGEQSENAHLFAVWRPYEIGAVQTGGWLNDLRDAVDAGDIPTLAGVIRAPLDLDSFIEYRDNGIILYSFVLRVGLQEIEHATLALNVSNLGADDLATRVSAWKEDKQEFLDRYKIEVVELRCEPIGAALSDGIVAYAHVERFRSLAMSLYTARHVEPAVDLFSGTIKLAEALVGSEPADPLVRTQMADAFNRLGFMLASLERCEEALEALAHSEQFNLERAWITTYNAAYIAARMQDFAKAASLGQTAIEELDTSAVSEDEQEIILHADIPTPNSWRHDLPWIRVVHIDGAWLKRFLKLQLAVWRARADAQHAAALEVELDACLESAPLPLLRLAGWSELTLTGRRPRGLHLLELAADATELHEVELARNEVARLSDTSDLAVQSSPSTLAGDQNDPEDSATH